MKNIELLKTVSLFWDLDKTELGYISDKMVSKKFENGNLIHFVERHHIEGRDASMIAGHLKNVYEEYCS